jgi:hypothetical protein
MITESPKTGDSGPPARIVILGLNNKQMGESPVFINFILAGQYSCRYSYMIWLENR